MNDRNRITNQMAPCHAQHLTVGRKRHSICSKIECQVIMSFFDQSKSHILKKPIAVHYEHFQGHLIEVIPIDFKCIDRPCRIDRNGNSITELRSSRLRVGIQKCILQPPELFRCYVLDEASTTFEVHSYGRRAL